MLRIFVAFVLNDTSRHGQGKALAQAQCTNFALKKLKKYGPKSEKETIYAF